MMITQVEGPAFYQKSVLTFRPMRPRIALLLLLLTLAAFSIQQAFAGSDDDDAAPRFHAKTMTGETYNNESIKGKVTLLEFWTTWCPYCRDEESLVDEINQKYSSKGLLVLAIDVNESKKTVKKYLEQHPRSCPIVLTEDTNLAAMYAANSYPIYVVIDKDGNVAATQRGAGGERSLRYLLRRGGFDPE
jgi:thiol-disulfide isomerase/thioredoxin